MMAPNMLDNLFPYSQLQESHGEGGGGGDFSTFPKLLWLVTPTLVC